MKCSQDLQTNGNQIRNPSPENRRFNYSYTTVIFISAIHDWLLSDYAPISVLALLRSCGSDTCPRNDVSKIFPELPVNQLHFPCVVLIPNGDTYLFGKLIMPENVFGVDPIS